MKGKLQSRSRGRSVIIPVFLRVCGSYKGKQWPISGPGPHLHPSRPGEEHVTTDQNL